MISVTGKSWSEKFVNKNLIEKIKQDLKFSDILSRLIISKKYDEIEIYNIEHDLNVSNVFINNSDFNLASKILINSIKNNENICILGDYDVDGSAATALVIRFLNHIKHPHFYYIPDREVDGYGASKKLFKKLILRKPKLVIMVDCGSTSSEAINFLNDKNIKSLIIDHHEINTPFPKANSIINPKKDNGYIKYDYFCATALTYFFLEIVIKKIKSSFNISNFLIYVVLATICDVMPLRKINKILAKNVINKFQIKKNNAFNSLFFLSDKKNRLNIDDLGFLIGPIINAGGRLGKSMYGTELLASDNIQIINKRSRQLIDLNNKRKKIENIILNKINFDKIQKDNKSIIIHFEPHINEGLIGIIAARLKDYFNKPSIVITNSNNLLKGSARSTNEYNIGHLINKLLKSKIIESGGGHNLAAGFTLKKINIKILEKFILNDYLQKKIHLNKMNKYDAEISPSLIKKDFINEIKKLEPFGNNNIMPIFFIKKIRVIKTKILNNKHVSAIIKPSIGPSLTSICFNCINTNIGNYLLSYKKDLNLVCQIQENVWNNKKNLQLIIKDIFI